jgi:hypothetical protein
VGGEAVATMDNDADGKMLAKIVQHAVELTGRADLKFRARLPDAAKDWNDVLRAKTQLFLPYRPMEFAPR